MYVQQIKYIVQHGDSLQTIADKFSTSIETIKGENRLASNTIYIGQQLAVPADTERTVYQSTTRRQPI